MDARDPASLLAMTERGADGPNIIVATVYTMYVLRWCESTRYRYSTFPLAVASPWLPRRLNPIPNSNPKLIGLSLLSEHILVVFTDKNRTPPSSRSLLIPLEVGYSSSSLKNRPFKDLGSTVSAVRGHFRPKTHFL